MHQGGMDKYHNIFMELETPSCDRFLFWTTHTTIDKHNQQGVGGSESRRGLGVAPMGDNKYGHQQQRQSHHGQMQLQEQMQQQLQQQRHLLREQQLQEMYYLGFQKQLERHDRHTCQGQQGGSRIAAAELFLPPSWGSGHGGADMQQ